MKGKQNFNNLHDTLLCLTIKYDINTCLHLVLKKNKN